MHIPMECFPEKPLSSTFILPRANFRLKPTIFFWVAAHGIFVEAWRIFSLRGGLFVAVLGLLSSCGMQVFSLSLRCVSSVVVAHGLSCPTACGILVPQPGIEPASPSLAGRFLTTGPPGKSQAYYYYYNITYWIAFWTSKERWLLYEMFVSY